jgi:hypothetical protein
LLRSRIIGGAPEEERVRQVDEVLDEAERELDVELRPEREQQPAAQERADEIVGREREHGRAEHQQKMPVRPREDPADDGRGKERHGEREQPQQNRRDEGPPEQRPLPQHRTQVAVDALRAAAARRPLGRRLERDRDARVRAPEARRRDSQASRGRIEDLDAALRQPVEDDEVAELPVEDRPARQVVQVVDVRLNAARRQAVGAGCLHDPERIGSVAARAGRVTKLVEPDTSAVVGQRHRETRGAAVRKLELGDVRNAAPHG